MDYYIKFTLCFKHLILLIFSLFLCAFEIAQAENILIFDAGSSGTRVYLFDVTYDNNLPKVTEIKLDNNKIKPGISSFADNPQDLAEYLKPLLLNLSKMSNISDISAYFYATAGMRFVSEDKQQKIYKNIKNIFDEYKVDIKDIKTISGEDEALFDWLSGNLQENAFVTGKTAVALDLGGASTQFAFNVPKEDSILANYKFYINNKEYYIIAQSLLGGGKDVAYQNLLKQNEKNLAVCYAYSFNFVKCEKMINSYLESFNVNKNLITEFRKVIKNNPRILGMSYYSYGMKYFDANNIVSLYKSIKDKCTNASINFEKENSLLCLNGVYVYSLLHDFYGIPKDYKQLVVNGDDYSWAQGAALNIVVNKK